MPHYLCIGAYLVCDAQDFWFTRLSSALLYRRSAHALHRSFTQLHRSATNLKKKKKKQNNQKSCQNPNIEVRSK